MHTDTHFHEVNKVHLAWPHILWDYLWDVQEGLVAEA